jgi:hypothetical protein
VTRYDKLSKSKIEIGDVIRYKNGLVDCVRVEGIYESTNIRDKYFGTGVVLGFLPGVSKNGLPLIKTLTSSGRHWTLLQEEVEKIDKI